MASKYGINDIVEMKNNMRVEPIVLKLLEWVLTLELSVNCQRSIMDLPRQTFDKNQKSSYLRMIHKDRGMIHGFNSRYRWLHQTLGKSTLFNAITRWVPWQQTIRSEL